MVKLLSPSLVLSLQCCSRRASLNTGNRELAQNKRRDFEGQGGRGGPDVSGRCPVLSGSSVEAGSNLPTTQGELGREPDAVIRAATAQMECSPGFLVCPAEPMQECWVCARLMSHQQGISGVCKRQK